MDINSPWDALNLEPHHLVILAAMISHPNFTNLLVNRDRKTPRWSYHLKGRRPLDTVTLKSLIESYETWLK